jgi:hypothetical protein
LPQGLAIQIAEGTTLEEPELFYLSFVRRAGNSFRGCYGNTVRPAARAFTDR